MFDKGQEEFAAKAGGKIAEKAANVAARAAYRRMRVECLQSKTKQLAQWVQTDANRPVLHDDTKIISSVACEGPRRDYMQMCMGYNGGLHIVYDEMGTGKSCALQAVARAKSSNQPDRFLLLNFLGTLTCQDLYKGIKDRVLGPVEDFEFTPEEVAEVVGYGLCGHLPSGKSYQGLQTPIEFRSMQR